MSHPSSVPAHPDVSPADAARWARNRRRRRVIGYSILAILILPPLADLVSDPFGEVADWHYAAALENYETGNRKQAEANLKASERWAPSDPQAHIARAGWRVREERYDEALEELNRAIEIGGETTQLLMERSVVYQHLQRYDEAVADWEKILAQTKPSLLERLDPTDFRHRRANVLNAVAYAQSLGKLDLPLALRRINESLELLGERGATAEKLDTRGYIHYLMGDYQLALADLNESIKQTDAFRRSLQDNLALLRRRSADVRNLELTIEGADRALAVMLYHRALVYDALGNEDRASADRERVREITGREAGEWLF